MCSQARAPNVMWKPARKALQAKAAAKRAKAAVVEDAVGAAVEVAAVMTSRLIK
jgi:hypothetical protein